MKLYFMALFACLSLFLCGTALAFSPPVPTGYVTDTTGSLSTGQVTQLNQSISDFNKRTQNEIAVLLIKSVGDESIEDVTNQTFKAWRVGKAGLDNGVLLVLAIESRKMRLETGKGIEGEITDVQSNDILVSMRPGLRAKDYNGAVTTATGKIMALLESRQGKAVDPGQGAQFNKQNVHDDNINPTPTVVQNTSCDVGAVGTGTGTTWFAALVILFVAVVIAVRALIRRNVSKQMEETERQVDAELAREKAEFLLRQENAASVARQSSELACLDNAIIEAKREAEVAKRAAEVKKAPVRPAAPKPVIKSPVPRPHRFETNISLKEKKEASSNELRAKLAAKAEQKKRAVNLQTVIDSAVAGTLVATSVHQVAEEAANQARQDAEARHAQADRDEETRKAEGRRKEREAAEGKRRQQEDDDRRSSSYSSSSSSSYDSSSSSSSDWSSGSFGGGSSGGGGSSSDW